MLNKQLWQDHEACVINFTCTRTSNLPLRVACRVHFERSLVLIDPFECFGFMAYFWVLAFVFIPRATNLQSWLAENTVPLIIDFNTTINTTMAGLDGLADTAMENQVCFCHIPFHFCLKCT